MPKQVYTNPTKEQAKACRCQECRDYQKMLEAYKRGMYQLQRRVIRLRNRIAKKRGICSHCGERYHTKPKLADDGYIPGWLCPGGGTPGRF